MALPKRILVGSWHDGADQFSHPQALVAPTWEMDRRHLIVQYLAGGGLVSVFAGYSYCRCGCEQRFRIRNRDRDRKRRYRFETHPLSNGDATLGDDKWCWPEGLAHYVQHHAIRLPDEFIAHAAAREFKPFGTDVGFVRQDRKFWIGWCERHAPFQYEARCLACQAAPRSDVSGSSINR